MGDPIVARIEALLDELAAERDPSVGRRAEELARLVTSMYGAGLGRIVEILRDDQHCPQALDALGADRVVGGLLALHDLHPVDLVTRVERALDSVRPYLGSHAGGVELLGVGADDVVRLRLAGTCDGCAASAVTVATAIETAVLDAAPELAGVEVENGTAEPGLLQISPYRPEDCLAGQAAGEAGAP